jgi:adenylate kinase family enzyme
MKRIVILGCGGAGKSILARRLGEILDLEVIHLDTVFWRPGWKPMPNDEFDEAQGRLLQGDSWIIDGNFSRTLAMRLAAADTAIFLDFPRGLCLRRAVKRWIQHHGKSRPDMADGCSEKLDLEFLRWIWRFPRVSRPKVLAMLACFSGRAITLRSPAEVERFVRGLTDVERPPV